MVLRKDSKGMIAFMDAMVFLTLLSIVAVCLFTYTSTMGADEPLAKTVSDQLYGSEVIACDVLDCKDTEAIPLPTAIAVGLRNGNTVDVEDILTRTLELMIPGIYGYELQLTYEGHSMTVYRRSGGEIISEYSSEISINGAGTLVSTLSIFAAP